MLTYIEFSHRNERSRKYNLYRCECGTQKIIREDGVKAGTTNSCGCKQKKFASKLGKSKKTHGLSKTSLYTVWSNMKNRCENPKYRLYKDYGGRGISYSFDWNNFDLFYRDMHKDYKKGLHLDRIDNNSDYCKENCRWTTRIENNNNKRNNVYLTHLGKTLSVRQWARELKINPSTIYMRIRYGWQDVNKILSK